MKSLFYEVLVPCMLGCLFFSSCEKDDPIPPNEEEVITSLTYSLTPIGGGTTAIFRFQDLDGDGGNPPSITTASLLANTEYEGFLSLLNEATTPAIDVTKEINDESPDHQFFYSLSGDAEATITYQDQDTNGQPLGLATRLSTANASQGQLKITLRHEPDKSASGVANGDIANAGGETDIEVLFELLIQ